MITRFDSRYLVNLSYLGVRVYGRVFATESLARDWEQDALSAIKAGLPLPDERTGKYVVDKRLHTTESES